MQGVAVGWQVYDLTGDFLDLGLIGLAQFAPFVLLVIPAGHVADRYDRKKLIVGCMALQLVCAAFLLYLSAFGLKSAWPVFAALVLQGIARAFSMPASQAFLTNIVPQSSFGQAIALTSSTFHVAVILGPTLGGALYIAGASTVYTIVATLLVAATLLQIPVKSTQQLAPRPSEARSAALDGFRFVWSRPVILGAVSLDLFAVLLGGAVALLPAYARDVLHTDSTGLGLLRTAPGIGAALTSAVLAVRPIGRRVGYWMFGGVAIYGLSNVALGLTNHFGLALSFLAIGGAADMVSVYVRHILVQAETPDEVRGRVSAVNAVFIGASNELGEFESGLSAAWLGLIPAILTGGALTILVTVVWSWRFAVLTFMDRFPHETKPVT
jgi:predicted MFS family arabinose efflux permease